MSPAEIDDPGFAQFSQFKDRREAGRKLAVALERHRADNPVILALPRGGVPVAYEVAEALGAPLDVIFVRKIGAPGHPEYGIGAVVDGADPQVVLNDSALQVVHPSVDYIQDEQRKQLAEIERRRALYRHGREPIPIKGRTVIVVDDGIATGGTVKAVLKALSQTGAGYIVLAVPVAPDRVLAELSELANEIVCLATPVPFHAVSLHYRDFNQTTDEEVIDLLDLASQRTVHRGHEAPAGAPHP